jgi:hypothetical protein
MKIYVFAGWDPFGYTRITRQAVYSFFLSKPVLYNKGAYSMFSNFLSVGIDVGSAFSFMSIVNLVFKPFKILHNDPDSLKFTNFLMKIFYHFRLDFY